MSKRVMGIFIVWACVYFLALAAQTIPHHGVMGAVKLLYWGLVPIDAGVLNLMLEGTKTHLWFLPALSLSVLISASFVASARYRSLAVLAVALFLIGLAGKAYSLTPMGFSSGFNFRNGPFLGLIFFVTGIFLAKEPPGKRRLPTGAGMVVLGALVQAAELLWLHAYWNESLVQNYVIGTYILSLGVALIALSNAQSLQLPRLAAIAPLALGIYACHYLFVDLLRPIDAVMAQNLVWEIAYVGIVFFLSFGLSAILAKFAPTRRFVT